MSYIVVGGRSRSPATCSPGMLIILESTTYPGTTDEVVQPMLEASGLKAGVDFFLAFSPERVDPGNPTFNTQNMPKVVGGIDAGLHRARRGALRRGDRDRSCRSARPRVAEMVKLLENTFRAVNIGLVNELALMCDRMDIDVWEVIDAAKTKPFGFMPFYPGPGPRRPLHPDRSVLPVVEGASRTASSARFIELAGHINGAMPHYVVDKVAEALNTQRKSVNGSRVLVARRRLQARHRRHARVAGARRHGAAARRRARRSRTPIRYVPESHGARVVRAASTCKSGRLHARRSIRPVPTASSSSPTTRRSTTTRWSREAD